MHIRINGKTNTTYFPEEVREAGYVDEIEVILGTCVILLRHPNATIPDTIKSLDLLKATLEHKLALPR